MLQRPFKRVTLAAEFSVCSLQNLGAVLTRNARGLIGTVVGDYEEAEAVPRVVERVKAIQHAAEKQLLVMCRYQDSDLAEGARTRDGLGIRTPGLARLRYRPGRKH